MANNLAQVGENLLLDHMTGKTAWTPTTPLKCRLMTANGDDTTTGTEVTGGSYPAGGVAIPVASWNAAAAGTATTNADVTYTGMPSCTVVGVELWDTNASAKRLWWGALTASKVVGAGDTFVLAAGDLSISLE